MSAASFDALGTDRGLGSAAYRDEDFPAGESFHLPASEIEHHDSRPEFWDGVTERAWRALERTALAMGEREGTTPQHDPLMASQSERVQARSHAQGHREGHAQGHMDAVAEGLAFREIEVTLEVTQHRELCSAIPGKVVMEAAPACTSEADFLRRIAGQRSRHCALALHPDPDV